MADVSGASKFFPKAQQNSVAMTLGGSILAGATTVPVNGMTNYADNDVVAFTVDAATPSLKQVFTGTKSGSNVINVVWTELPTGGSNVAHSAGATVIDYVSATHWDLVQKGVTSSLNQDGSLITTAVQTALNITGGAVGGWTPSGFAPSAVAANGNRSYTLTFAAQNLTTIISNGMRLQTTRTVAAPTQCTSLNGTTQYYSKATPSGMTFTDDFTVSAWIKLTSYNGTINTIASRYNGTSGWGFFVLSDGRVQLQGINAGAANHSEVQSYQSIPLNKWVHVSANLDMSAFSTNTDGSATGSCVTIDGVNVPASVTRAGTNPTALIQAGNLEIGGLNGGTLPFTGKLAQVAIFSAKITNATILTYISQGLAGTETSLISAYSFNNSINDLNANANNLTANGSAVATNADSPFGGQADGTISSTLDYGIITKTAFSTNTTLTVQVPEGCTIPTSGGVSAVSYATVKAPYGFPAQQGKWNLIAYINVQSTQGNASASTWYNIGSHQLNIPIGSWNVSYQNSPVVNTSSATVILRSTLSTANNSASDTEFIAEGVASPATALVVPFYRRRSRDLSAATPYYLNISFASGSGTVNLFNTDTTSLIAGAIIEAECALL